ncbi:MAG: HEAT repeat domain-containing protein, partial [Planctomycetota bacterium]
VRAGAVELLGELGDEESAKDIFVLLRDGHSEVRSASARALAKLKAKDAGDEIFKALKDEKVLAAQIAFVEALGELGYEPADEFIIAIIRDETSPLFLPAVGALSKIGSDKARDALVDLLMRAEDFEMLDLAGSAVALVSESAIPVLNEKLKDASIDDRARILRGFSHMGPEAIPHIIRFMENEPYPFLQDRAAKALREMAKRLYDENIKWGPRYDDPPAEKREDIKRWKNWWAEKEKQ